MVCFYKWNTLGEFIEGGFECVFELQDWGFGEDCNQA